MPLTLKKVLFLSGCLLCLHASWLPIKGLASQILISHSWQQTLAKNQPIKPWPWADTYPIAVLVFERINKNIVVLNGGDPTTLAFSAGAVAPFNQPMATKPFVVAGHRDSHFSFLEDVVMNDIISLADKHGRSELYQVEAIDIVDANTGQLPVLADDTTLVLITCYPFKTFNANTHSGDKGERYVITARKL